MSDKQELVETTQGPMMSMIERMVRDPQIDVLKLGQLMELQERAEKRDAQLAYNKALKKAQSEIGRISADKTNAQTRSSYASYAALDRVVRPIYTDNGFSLSFDTAESKIESHIKVILDISHEQGHTGQKHIDIPADGKGAKGGDVMTKTHATGSGVSYAMRYLLKMAFNIAIGDDPDDDDGNSAGNQNPKNDKPKPASMTEDHVATVRALCEEAKVAVATICKAYKVSSLEEFPDTAYETLVTRLNLTIKGVDKK